MYSHWVAVHVVRSVQVRSDVLVLALDSHSDAVQVLSVAHTRSEVSVDAMRSHWVCEQTVSAPHRRSSLSLPTNVSNSDAVHCVIASQAFKVR